MMKGKFYLIIVISLQLILLLNPLPLAAGEENGLKTSTDLEMQVSTRPEARLRLNQTFILPFLQAENPLMRDNNIKFVIGAYVTPLSVAAVSEITWTPLAFLLLSGGGQAGSAWNIPLGSDRIGNGMGLNTPKGPKIEGKKRLAEIKGGNFDGLVWRAWGAGTFQFDLGAIIPGDWTHVVLQTRQEFRYSAYTRAGPGDSWIFENDDAENRNGWRYYATYIFGYQMPASPVLKMVGLMAEVRKNFYNTQGGDFWGDNLGYWIFSVMSNFSITPMFSATTAIQMRTRRNHAYIQFEHNRDFYYQDIELLNEGGERRLVFYRVAVILNYKLR